MSGTALIIGIVGLKQSGKTTLARILKEHLGSGVEEFAFADPIKRALISFGVPPKAVYGTDQEKNQPLKQLKGKSGRDVMTSLGTEWGQKMVYPSLWVDILVNDINRHQPQVAIISDIRHEHERQALREAGAVIIHVRRHREGRWKRLKRRLFAHGSEKGLTPLHDELILENSGSLRFFEISANRMIKHIASYTNLGHTAQQIGIRYRAEIGPLK